jgi:hypothetical protein
VTVDCLYGCIVAVESGGGADAVLKWVLRRDDEIYHIKTGLLDHVSDDGEVADM